MNQVVELDRLTFAVFTVGMQLEADFARTFVPTERIDTIVLATVIRQLALVEFFNAKESKRLMQCGRIDGRRLRDIVDRNYSHEICVHCRYAPFIKVAEKPAFCTELSLTNLTNN